ncbi:transporter [Enterococcus sp. JM4C]|uniref:MFS transporter n=1 Tax=Candidatus Enterococcus huntleyi TaxID=1857217 RepID=UPI00137A6909|nr:MFS transporter [Enterococcus sp. JM4C]KAF1297188.1 transporter [Enterococcus sp. JM4C]
MTNKKTITMWLALIGAFLTVLDTGILYTGTVKLAEELHLNANQLSWVQVVYVLTYAEFMLLGGKLGDIYGRKKFFIASLLVFAIGSLLVGVSTNAPMIIGFRAVQGVGAAILQPTCLALLTDTFEGEELQKVIGYYAAVIGAGAAVGIAFGGFCAAFASWRVGFLINAPIAIIMSLIAAKVLAESSKKVAKLDWLGTILSVLAMGSLSYGIGSTQHRFWLLLLSAVIWLVFIFSQIKAKEPMIPLVIFQNRERLGSYLGSLLFSGAGVIFWFYIPQFMQIQLGYSPFISAMGMIPMSILLFVIALQVRKIIAKFGNSLVMIVGLLLVLLSASGLAYYANTTSYWVVFPFTLTFGVGFALALTPLTTSAMAQISPSARGAASGVYNTTRQFGAALGLALGLAVSTNSASINELFRSVMLLASVLVVSGIIFVVILVLGKGKISEHDGI